MTNNQNSQTLESSLLYVREDESQTFVHDTYKEFFLAKWFADKINSGRLSIQQAYKQFWSYETDKDMWGLEGRILLPRWKPILVHISSLLSEKKEEELFEIVKQEPGLNGDGLHYSLKHDFEFSFELINSPTLREKIGKALIEKLYNTINKGFVLLPVIEVLKRRLYGLECLRETLGEDGIKKAETLEVPDVRTIGYITGKLKRIKYFNDSLLPHIFKGEHIDHELAKLIPPEKVASLLDDTDADEIYKLRVLIRLSSENGIYHPKMESLLNHPSLDSDAAAALVKVGHYEPLDDLINHKNWMVAQEAFKAIALKGDFEGLMEILRLELETSQPIPSNASFYGWSLNNGLKHTAYVIYHLRENLQVTRLLELLNSSNKFVRYASADALHYLVEQGRVNQVAELTALVNDEVPEISAIGVVALARQGIEHPLVEYFSNYGPVHLRLKALEAFYLLNKPDRVVTHLKDEDELIRDNATFYLNEMGLFEPVANMINDPSDDVQNRAVFALGYKNDYATLLELSKRRGNIGHYAIGALKLIKPEIYAEALKARMNELPTSVLYQLFILFQPQGYTLPAKK